MKIFEYVITNEEGIHAIPASVLTKTSQEYQSDIYLYRGEQRADMKNLFDVMGMCIKRDTQIRLEIDGEDEEAAMERISGLLKSM